MSETVGEPFVIAALARGVPRSRIVWRGALKAALRPVAARLRPGHRHAAQRIVRRRSDHRVAGARQPDARRRCARATSFSSPAAPAPARCSSPSARWCRISRSPPSIRARASAGGAADDAHGSASRSCSIAALAAVAAPVAGAARDRRALCRPAQRAADGRPHHRTTTARGTRRSSTAGGWSTSSNSATKRIDPRACRSSGSPAATSCDRRTMRRAAAAARAPTATAATSSAACCSARACRSASRSTAALGAMLVGALLGGLAGFAGGALDDVVMRADRFRDGAADDLRRAGAARRAAARAHGRAGVRAARRRSSRSSARRSSPAAFARSSVPSAGQEYAAAAQALGASDLRLLVRHLLPAARGFLAVQITLLVPAFIIAEATLSYVGLGFPDPVASWGTMLHDASTTSASSPIFRGCSARPPRCSSSSSASTSCCSRRPDLDATVTGRRPRTDVRVA